MTQRIYVIVYKDTNKVANWVYFGSRDEAWEWKKRQIDNGNSIDTYGVISLWEAEPMMEENNMQA